MKARRNQKKGSEIMNANNQFTIKSTKEGVLEYGNRL